jgi:hypothetical protein
VCHLLCISFFESAVYFLNTCQLDEDTPSLLMNWIPSKLAPHIRCVFSMIDGTPQHLALSEREPQPYAITLNPLTEENRKVSDAFTFWF